MNQFKRVFLFIIIMVFASNLILAKSSANRLEVKKITASSDDGNVPSNTSDAKLETRWSANGDGEWIKFDFGSEKEIDYLALAFYKGDIRYTPIDIEISNDNSKWEKISSWKSAVKTKNLQKIDIDKIKARYVKIIGHGYVFFDDSKTGAWNSFTEVQFYSSDKLKLDKILVAEGEKPKSVRYTKAGFFNPDGSVHILKEANKVTGKTINVLDYGADLTDSENDDAKAIQKALKAAKKGDEVYLPDGSYQLYSRIKLVSGVNLRGESKEGTVLVAKKDKKKSKYQTTVMEAVAKKNILVSDFTLTSDFSGKYSTSHKINNPDRDGPKYMLKVAASGKSGNPSYDVIVDNLIIEKYRVMGVRVEKAHDITVRNTTFRNATDLGGGGAGYGISIQGAGYNENRLGYKNDSRYNLVENCNFVGPYIRHGVLIQYFSHNNVIRNNKFSKTKLDAIDLHGEDEYLNEIYGNMIFDIETGAGIGVGNSGATHDKSGKGNYIHSNVISNAREGIKVHLSSEDTVIENNIIKNSKVIDAKGVYLQNAPGTLVKSNIFKDNLSDNFWGVVVDYDKGTGDKDRGQGVADRVSISNNEFNMISNGILINAGTRLKAEDNKFEGITGKELEDNRPEEMIKLKKPSDIISLKGWKITLPLDEEYKDSSTANKVSERARPAVEIVDEDLIDYEYAPYFQVDDNGVRFRAHVAGATTKGSKYPRCELRQRVGGGNNYWSVKDEQSLVTEFKVTAVPVMKPEISMVQIHGPEDEPLRVQYHAKKGVYIVWNESNRDTKNALKYELGQMLRVEVTVKDSYITCKIKNLDTSDSYVKVWKSSDETGYFKVGAYTQSSMFLNEIQGGAYPDEPLDAYGEMIVYKLELEETY